MSIFIKIWADYNGILQNSQKVLGESIILTYFPIRLRYLCNEGNDLLWSLQSAVKREKWPFFDVLFVGFLYCLWQDESCTRANFVPLRLT